MDQVRRPWNPRQPPPNSQPRAQARGWCTLESPSENSPLVWAWVLSLTVSQTGHHFKFLWLCWRHMSLSEWKTTKTVQIRLMKLCTIQAFSGMSSSIILSMKIITIPVFPNILPSRRMPPLIFFTLTLSYNILSQKLATEEITRMQGRNIIKSFWAIVIRPNSIKRNSKRVFKNFYSVQIL